MRALARVVFFAAVIGLCVWFFYRQSRPRATATQPPSPLAEERSREALASQPGTQEDRVQWRETIDRRLRY